MKYLKIVFLQCRLVMSLVLSCPLEGPSVVGEAKVGINMNRKSG
jgi:hypothetical protein